MALTRNQWYAKISKFVPSWWFEDAEADVCYAVALFQAIAAILEQVQKDADDQFDATFITRQTTPIEDLSGQERGIPRNPGESDVSYAARIQQLFGVSDEPNLQEVVDGVLNNGPAFLIENAVYGFYDDEFFLDDTVSRLLDLTAFYNWFTIIIPIQTAGDQAVMQAAIITALEADKALGVTYDVLYGSVADTDTAD